MNPFLVTKPKVQRRAELDQMEDRAAKSKKKSLDRNSTDRGAKKSGGLTVEDPVEFYEEPPKTKSGDKNKAKKKTRDKESGSPDKVKKKKKKKVDEWGMTVYSPKESPIKTLSKIKGKKLRSILATNREELLQMVEDDAVDTASAAIYKRMLQALVDVIGHTEDMIHRSKGARGTHQMNLLVNNIRDILIDLQQAQDRGMLADNLCQRHLAPSYLAIGMKVLQENEQLFNRIKRENDRETVDRYSQYFAEQEKRIGDFVQDQFVRVREEVRKYLQR